MRGIPTDKNGKPIFPPRINPSLDSRVIDGRRIALVTQTRSYELITPLFGGGAEPGRADSDMVIRGSGIRGQLRFWWRACRGGRFAGDLREMKKAEDMLWGATSTPEKPRPSQVEVLVKTTEPGMPLQPFVLRLRDNRAPVARADEGVAPPYVAFPLQPKEEDIRRNRMNTIIHPVMDDVKFDLTITFPESQRAEVEAALWAWETFGGVGGRTRRGFGALKLAAVDGKRVQSPRTEDVKSAIQEGLRKHVTGGEWADGVPHLSTQSKMAISPNHSDPKKAWKHLVEKLSRFRQQRNRGADSPRPGRSQWPEPDEIRRLTGSRSSMHAHELSIVRKFPRAAFGLPIVFHFKDWKYGDPPTATLEGSADRCKRLASPLVLRPLACEGGSAVGLAMILEGTSVAQIPDGLVVKESDGERREHRVEASLTTEEAAQIRPLRGKPDTLDAFLKFLIRG
jgi:CRISPR-associated protein Cmr1